MCCMTIAASHYEVSHELLTLQARMGQGKMSVVFEILI